MRLILHNHLLDENGKPYKIKEAKTKVILKEYDASYVLKILSSINFGILQNAAKDLGIDLKPFKNVFLRIYE